MIFWLLTGLLVAEFTLAACGRSPTLSSPAATAASPRRAATVFFTPTPNQPATPSQTPTAVVTATAPVVRTVTREPFAPTAFAGPYTVSVRVEPIVPTNLGDRVLGPVTVYVDAPGATRVEVYVQAVDRPYGGQPVGEPKLIGTDDTPANGFAVPWAADERDPSVNVYAIAYGQPDVNYSRSSTPVTILLDWQLRGTPLAH